MRHEGNILILTQWSFKDALVQTYTLPYVSIIRSKLPAASRIFLVTYEQGKLALSRDDIGEVNNRWKNENMELVTLPYKRFGIKKLISVIGHISALVGLIKKNKIKLIHSFCTTAGSTAYIL